MKLTRFQHRGAQAIGCWIDDWMLDLSSLVPALSDSGLNVEPGRVGLGEEASMTDFLAAGPHLLDWVRQLTLLPRERLADQFSLLPSREVELLAPLAAPGKILCLGQNYRDHCLEQGVPLPESPVLFAKMNNSILDPGKPIRIPTGCTHVDFEAELAFVIGKKASRVDASSALDHVAGYLILNDVTERSFQKRDGQWVRAKSCDTFGPMGPALTTADEIENPQNLAIRLTLNDQLMQDSSTSQLIFTIPFIVEFISRTITLNPGDIISTGTPPGVGAFRSPPIFLQPGDKVTVEIEGLGSLTNPVE